MSRNRKDNKNIFQRDLSVKEVLLVLGIVTITGIYGYSFVYPSYLDYKTTRDEVIAVNSEISRHQSEINNLPKKKEELEDLEDEIRISSKILAHNMEDGMFVIGLSKVMESVDVDLVDYSIEESIEYDTFYAIPTSLTLRGDYKYIREVMNYLEEQKNMTQILDYNMVTFIPEEEALENEPQISLVPDPQVYWTAENNLYHKISCEKIIESNGEYFTGTAQQSNKDGACEICEPYTKVTLEEDESEVETGNPKSEGLIEATFRFMMYSTNEPELELDNDDPSEWKPGKFNPFVTTTR